MGIPGLFGSYYRKWKCENDLIVDYQSIKKTNHLFIDYNSLIHPCGKEVLDKEPLKSDAENLIIENTLKYTKYLIELLCNDKGHVYLYIDGVAPAAKLKQQRERRYKSEFLKTKDSIWDTNMISPGTAFMSKLSGYMKELQVKNTTIIVDTSASEAEHKIMRHISKMSEPVSIYGLDCITEDTPLLLLNINGDIEIQTVERLVDNWNYIDGKEYGKTNYKVWSENGWTEIKNIRRNKTSKDIFRILTNTGCVDVTEDHKLLKHNHDIIKPINCELGDELLNKFPSFNENKITIPNNLDKIKKEDLDKLASILKIKQYQKSIKSELINRINNVYDNNLFIDLKSEYIISNDEAYIMGLFWADGTCGIYNSKKNPKWKQYQWYISNCDLKLLENTKIKLEKCYNHLGITFTIIQDNGIHTDNYNRQQQYKLNANGGVKKILLIEKYIKMFYYKNKHQVFKNGNKYICKEILNANKDIRTSFLTGYYNGDGTGHSLDVIQKGMDVESKISTQCIYYLCKSLGYEVSVNIRDDKPNIYKLTITKGYQLKQSNKIKKIKNLGKTNNYVYDLETDNHHFQSGIGDLIIHNCDIIMLSLMNKNYKNISLIRDNSFDERETKESIILLDVSRLYIKITNEIKSYLDLDNNVKFNNDHLIRDYVTISFLLGNDFLDHLPNLEIKKNGMHVLLQMYAKTVTFTKEFLVNNDYTLNKVFLRHLFYNISRSEEYYFNNLFKPNVCKEKDLENEKVTVYRNEDFNFGVGYETIRKNYYTYYGIQQREIYKSCQNYLTGMQWVLGYYNGHSHNNWSYIYNYNTSPFASDIYKYICETKDFYNNSDLESNGPIREIEQLFCILPKNSLVYSLCTLNETGILEKFEQNTEFISKFYPTEIYLDMVNKDFYWKSKVFFNNKFDLELIKKLILE
jgi:hypothetical protein